MGQGMSASTPAPASVVDQPSFVRLHGEACWFCGAVNGPFSCVGTVSLDDDIRAWPVVACQTHQGRRLP